MSQDDEDMKSEEPASPTPADHHADQTAELAVTAAEPAEGTESGPPDQEAESDAKGAEPVGETMGHMMLSRVESVSDEVRRSPGFLFLTRPDLYKFAKVKNIVTFT